MARTKESAIRIKDTVEKFLSVRGLKLSEKKTKIVNVSDGFDFLSRNYCKKNGILCTAPSERAVRSFEENLHDYILNKGKQQSQRTLIKGVNARLQGWAGYHRIEYAIDAFRHIDCLVQSLLLRLMQKLFPTKTKKQIIEQYWYEEADGTKIYALPHRKDIRIFRMKDVVLTEHIPVILNKNPYIDTDYFNTRLESQDVQKINGDFKSIWKRQKGKCYYCGRKIYESDLKQIIHIGSIDDNSPQNLAYIHKSCDMCETMFIQTNIENPNETDIFEIVEEICGRVLKELANKMERNKRYISGLKNKQRHSNENFKKTEKKLTNVNPKYVNLEKPLNIRLEMDEMWGRVNSKKTSSWLWHAINHDNGDVVAYVIGSRHHDMLWQLTDLIYSLNLNITAVCSDNNFAYHDIIPSHTLHTGKINTQKIERKHLSFRTRLKRLARKTICFSKSHSMHNILLGLLINVTEFNCHFF